MGCSWPQGSPAGSARGRAAGESLPPRPRRLLPWPRSCPSHVPCQAQAGALCVRGLHCLSLAAAPHPPWAPQGARKVALRLGKGRSQRPHPPNLTRCPKCRLWDGTTSGWRAHLHVDGRSSSRGPAAALVLAVLSAGTSPVHTPGLSAQSQAPYAGSHAATSGSGPSPHQPGHPVQASASRRLWGVEPP